VDDELSANPKRPVMAQCCRKGMGAATLYVVGVCLNRIGTVLTFVYTLDLVKGQDAQCQLWMFHYNAQMP
jgi:hypothetical protein